MVTALDHLTRFAETAAILTANATEVANFFIQNLLLHHASPRVLPSNKGRAFLSHVLEEVLSAYNVLHKTTSSYYPQTNGLTERFHRTLAAMISMYVSPEHTNWDILLPFVTYAYNISMQSTTGYSPFRLTYGREPTSTLDTIFPPPPIAHHSNALNDQLRHTEDTRQLAQLRTSEHQRHRKQSYDSRHKTTVFQPGDLIMVSLPTRQPGRCEKFLPHYMGPYRVFTQTSPVNYLVESRQLHSGRRRSAHEVVHVGRLKPFIPR